MDKEFIAGLESLFVEGFKEGIVDLFGHSWKIRTLDEERGVWRDKHVQISFQTSFLSASRVPTLAVAIQEIDGRKVTDIFGEVYHNAETLATDMLTESFIRTLPGVAAENLRQFLVKQPEKVIDGLFLEYKKLEEAVDTALVDLTKEDDFFRGDKAEASKVADEVTNDEKNESSANRSESKEDV